MAQLKKHAVFFEIQGGSDKGSDGHRKDTMPMVQALEKKGWSAEAIFYSPERCNELLERVAAETDVYISRINPGKDFSEIEYFQFLDRLLERGVVGLPHPTDMSRFGAKDAMVKLTQLTDCPQIPLDSYAYYSLEELKTSFPKVLTTGERVLKQNRGSTGEGIWRVQLVDTDKIQNGRVPFDARIRCTEAVDNHVEETTLGEFMDFCNQYIVGHNGMLVDMRFLPRITEGEMRILLVHDVPVYVVHKQPKQEADAFSATLFSGAKYTYQSPDDPKWKDVVETFLATLPAIMRTLDVSHIPLLWTADFILDYDPQGNDIYLLSELNCSCVGFTTHLSMADTVADKIIQITTQVKEDAGS